MTCVECVREDLGPVLEQPVGGRAVLAAPADRRCVEKRPEIYADAGRCLAALPTVKRRLAATSSKLARDGSLMF